MPPAVTNTAFLDSHKSNPLPLPLPLMVTDYDNQRPVKTILAVFLHIKPKAFV